MRARLLAAAVLMCASQAASAQLATPQTALRELMRDPPRVLIVPGYTFVAGAVDERTLAARVRWPAADSPARLTLTLVGDVVSAGRDLYSRSGVEARVGARAGRASVTGAASIAAGAGSGPSQSLVVRVSAGVPAATLEFRTTWLRESSGSDPLEPASDVTPGTAYGYTDGELHGGASAGPVRFRLTAGVRFGAARSGPGQWIWGEVEQPLRGRFGLVASGGVRPSLPELAQRGGRFAFFGLRLDTGDGGEAPVPATAPRGDASALLVTPLAVDRYRIRLRIPGARRVELNGDVTDWRPVTMTMVPSWPGQWETVLATRPGTYQVNVRADDGDWIVPPGLVPLPDRFGGSVGLLTLPPVEDTHESR